MGYSLSADINAGNITGTCNGVALAKNISYFISQNCTNNLTILDTVNNGILFF